MVRYENVCAGFARGVNKRTQGRVDFRIGFFIADVSKPEKRVNDHQRRTLIANKAHQSRNSPRWCCIRVNVDCLCPLCSHCSEVRSNFFFPLFQRQIDASALSGAPA